MALSLLATVFLGLVLGSFASALAYRVPRGLSWIYGPEGKAARSACPSCGRVLGVGDLVPVLSWMLLRGRCRGCRAPIPAVYPLIEIATLAGCLGVWFVAGLNVNALLMMLAVPFLVALIAIDLAFLCLPNQLIGILAALGVLRALWMAFWMKDPVLFLVFVISGLAYALLAWGLRAAMSALLNREALGQGDVKFFGAAGIWLGLYGLPPFLLLSGVCGVVSGLLWQKMTGQRIFPFGPALILGFYGVLIMMAAL